MAEPEDTEDDAEETQQLRQVPENAELWQAGDAQYLVYHIPGHADMPLTWKIEDPKRIEAIWGEEGKTPDRTMDPLEFLAMSPWYGGLTAELRDTEDDPWVQFQSDYLQALNVRPWLNDPTMLATVATAYLEGREPTRDELAQTDWWNNHTAAERAWLETSVTAGTEEVERQRQDMRLQVDNQLRQAGMDTSRNQNVVDWVADKVLTGQWSEQYTATQMRNLVDPFAGNLDPELEKVVQDEFFKPDETHDEEERVRQLAAQWLGPQLGSMTPDRIREWAGRIRNDPDAEGEYLEMLRQQRMALLPGYTNPNLSYEDIVTPVRNLAQNIWGRPMTDETMLVDLANTQDYTEMTKRLRKSGLDQGVAKVVTDALDNLDTQAIGERVVRSSI